MIVIGTKLDVDGLPAENRVKTWPTEQTRRVRGRGEIPFEEDYDESLEFGPTDDEDYSSLATH